MPQTSVAEAEVAEETVGRELERFSVSFSVIQKAQDRRIDASYFNPAVARALDTLRHSGMILAPLGSIVTRVFIPGRFKRIYVKESYGLPFLQGSHVVHFQPADIKYVSRTAHKKIDQWIIKKNWLLVTRSGTVGRVMLCPEEWDGWAGSEHILRIIPDEAKCPGGYLYSFLASGLGKIQLTAQIYGAVVDELTEDQTKSVLVPLPKTDEQKRLVAKIDEEARQAVATRSKAVSQLMQSVSSTENLIQPDKEDAEIAATRLEEIRQNPNALVSGETLERRLART
jgi:type I restriction enzyme S subunit